MKKLIFILSILTTTVFGQTYTPFSYSPKFNGSGIFTGTLSVGQNSGPNPSAAFEVFSTNKGFLMPRLTTLQRNSINYPSIGLMIYNTTTSAFNFYNGSSWVAAIGPTGATGPTGANGATGATGATGPVAGSDTQIIFNDGGVSGADADLTWNKTTNTLSATSLISSASGAFTSANSLVVGQASTATGKVLFRNASTAFAMSIQSGATSGANYTLTLPIDDGTASQVLTTDGSGVLSWSTPATGITIGTTPITGGSTGLVLYQKSDGTVQESEFKYAAPGSTYAPAIITVGNGVNHVIKFVNGGGTSLMNLEEGVALGQGASVYTSFSTYKVAIGQSATASANRSTAVGALSSATHSNSSAFGYGATTTAANQLMFGASASAGGSGVYDNVCFNGSSNTTPAPTVIHTCDESGTDQTSTADLTLQPSLGTGTGIGASLIVKIGVAGLTGTSSNTATEKFRINNLGIKATLPAYADDAAAGVAGLTAGQFYQTTGAGAAPLNVAGIVMTKQ